VLQPHPRQRQARLNLGNASLYINICIINIIIFTINIIINIINIIIGLDVVTKPKTLGSNFEYRPNALES